MFKNIGRIIRRRLHADLRDEAILYKPVIRTLLSYVYNDALIKQGVNLDGNEHYKYTEYIHKILSIHSTKDGKLIRMGRKGDGGYIMHDSLSKTKIAYSIGICDDVSWDMQMAEKGYHVYMYDHTIDGLPIDCPNFHWKKKGVCGRSNTDANLITLEQMLKDNGHENTQGMVLKIDVEGFEWEVLESIDDGTLNKFDQILMEIHDLNDFSTIKKKISCLEKLTRCHRVIHVHGNNNGSSDFSGKFVTPNYIEITLLNTNNYSLEKADDIILPRNLDIPCTERFPEIILGKWNA